MRHVSSGPLRYSRMSDGGYRLVLEVDPGIIELARALVPPTVRLNRTRYAPHISVIRGVEPGLKAWLWGKHEGELVPFEYDTYLWNDETYWWLRCWSDRLVGVREELGLGRLSWACRPPDGADAFHTTVGNTK